MVAQAEIHVFEKAGLGQAPFCFVGCTEKRGPITVSTKGGASIQVGSPGQPMGVCDFCGTGIAICCEIQSADGKRFVVGSECVAKTGDAGLRKVVNAATNKIEREKRHKREAETVAWLRGAMADQTTRDTLAALPHPQGFTNRATGEPLSALEWCEWMAHNSGNAGKCKVAAFIRRNVTTQEPRP